MVEVANGRLSFIVAGFHITYGLIVPTQKSRLLGCKESKIERAKDLCSFFALSNAEAIGQQQQGVPFSCTASGDTEPRGYLTENWAKKHSTRHKTTKKARKLPLWSRGRDNEAVLGLKSDRALWLALGPPSGLHIIVFLLHF